MRRFIFFMLISTVCLCTQGQTKATVSGRIFDKTSGESLPFATIILMTENIQDTLTGVLSERVGLFLRESKRETISSPVHILDLPPRVCQYWWECLIPDTILAGSN